MILIDRSIPKSVATALKAVREDVCWLDDYFPHDTKDADWLPVAGKNGWLVITRDKKIRTRPGERRAILENNVGCFCLIQKKDPTRWQYLKLLVMTLEKMERSFATTPRPFIYGVDQSGKLSLITPPSPTSQA